ncbi:hypothetical protein H0R92_11825, partial [Treponema sp. OMZ 840]|uniref:hypothetical protein n=1 Tax=Treponema sp. OMZ 840 TaxID=244313 RepID=UPI003D935277
DIFGLDFVHDAKILAELENTQEEIRYGEEPIPPDIPNAAAEDIFNVESEQDDSSLLQLKKAQGEKHALISEDDDIFDEELRIGETSPHKIEPQPSNADSGNHFSDFKIGMPDFSILDVTKTDDTKDSDTDSDTDKQLPVLQAQEIQTADTDIQDADFVETLPFSFTLGTVPVKPDTVSPAEDSVPILEKNGLFIVSEEAGNDITEQNLDTEFQSLVDSVLK